MINEPDYHNVTAWLDDCRRPLLLSHQRPDGDALGALAGMALSLRQRGLEPLIALYEPYPSRYKFLQSGLTWHEWEQAHEMLTARCDAVVVLDTCAYAQLEPVADYLQQAPRTLVLDHHTTRDQLGTRAEDHRLIDESASAVCLLVAEWARTAGVSFDEPLAQALFTGITTDCGWFRFSNTDTRTLRVAADLRAAGALPNRIFAALYEQDSLARLRLIGRMLGSLELHADGKLAVMYIRPADLSAVGADHNMTADLINEAGRLQGLEATLLFTEHQDVIRINFRSKLTLDVAALAATFGGGGHARAAGARIQGAWDEIIPKVIATAVAALGNC